MSQAAYSAQSKNIGELLGVGAKAKLVVPEFRRGYSWQKRHVDVFWNDIVLFQKRTEKSDQQDEYFLGPIVVLPKGKSTIYLLDGQQRLATATILLSVLRDIAKNLGTKDAEEFSGQVQTQLILNEDSAYTLEMGETDKLYFQETIQSESAATVKTKPKLRSHRNIKTAKDTLTAHVKQKIETFDPGAITESRGWLAAE
jgi:uncharacterized protein with ParB-like and HNH nuclease domain